MGIRRCSHGHLYLDLETDRCPECGESSTAPGNRLIWRASTAADSDGKSQEQNDCAEYPHNHENDGQDNDLPVYAGPPLHKEEDLSQEERLKIIDRFKNWKMNDDTQS